MSCSPRRDIRVCSAAAVVLWTALSSSRLSRRYDSHVVGWAEAILNDAVLLGMAPRGTACAAARLTARAGLRRVLCYSGSEDDAGGTAIADGRLDGPEYGVCASGMLDSAALLLDAVACVDAAGVCDGIARGNLWRPLCSQVGRAAGVVWSIAG